MVLAIRQLTVVAGNATAEILRAPVYCLLLLTALLLGGILPTLDYLSFLEKRRFVADSLLALTFCTGVFAATAGAVAVVGDEIRRRTVLLVLSKPVSRAVLLAGKLAGLGAALGLLWVALATMVLWGSRVALDDYWPDRPASRVYFLCLLAALLVAAGVNYVSGRSFASAAAVAATVALLSGFLVLLAVKRPGLAAPGWALVDWRLAPATVLAYPAMGLAACVALAVSCWLDAVPTLLTTLALWLIGLVSDSLFARLGDSLAWRLLQGVLPNWQSFWVADALAAGRLVSWGHVLGAAAYAALYGTAVLLLSVAVFERRELG